MNFWIWAMEQKVTMGKLDFVFDNVEDIAGEGERSND